MLTLSHKEIIDLNFFKTCYFVLAFSEMQKTVEMNALETEKPVVSQLRELLKESNNVYKDTTDFVADNEKYDELCQMWEEGKLF